MPEYRLTIDKRGYDPSYARSVRGIVSSFMRGYEQPFKISVDEKHGVLEFMLKTPEDALEVGRRIRIQKSLKGHGFRMEQI
jgi:hypothetical protein